MIIKITRKEALNFFKRKFRRKIKKHEKRKEKDPEYKKAWDASVDKIDHFLAFGDE